MPLVACVPVQAPLAVQALALVDDQLSAANSPGFVVLGVTPIVTVGESLPVLPLLPLPVVPLPVVPVPVVPLPVVPLPVVPVPVVPVPVVPVPVVPVPVVPVPVLVLVMAVLLLEPTLLSPESPQPARASANPAIAGQRAALEHVPMTAFMDEFRIALFRQIFIMRGRLAAANTPPHRVAEERQIL